MKLNDIRIDNSRYMECVDELATQITEMNFGADTYAESSEVGQENVMMFTEEAQDYYNEKYDEYDSLINESIINNLNNASEYKSCDRCCYDIVDDDGDIMEHVCIDDVEFIKTYKNK